MPETATTGSAALDAASAEVLAKTSAQNAALPFEGMSRAEGRPAKVSAAVDRTTGKVYTGKSGPNYAPDEYHPELQDHISQPSNEARWPRDNCAEVRCLDAALKDGAKLEDLTVYTVDTDAKNFLQPWSHCKNRQDLKGPTFPSDQKR